jgi:hypothetical protein
MLDDLKEKKKYWNLKKEALKRSRDSSVGIATSNRLDISGIESRWGARFFAHVQTGPGAQPASCTMGTGSFLGVKQLENGADHPPPSSAKVTNAYSYTSSPTLGLRGLF